jgi:hypothetical protein
MCRGNEELCAVARFRSFRPRDGRSKNSLRRLLSKAEELGTLAFVAHCPSFDLFRFSVVCVSYGAATVANRTPTGRGR